MNLRASYPGRVELDARRATTCSASRRSGASCWTGSGGPYLFGDFTAADAMFAPVATPHPDLRAAGLRRGGAAMSRRSTRCRLPGVAGRRRSRSRGSSRTTRSTAIQGRSPRRCMMHMIKLCVGVATLEELESYRDERAHWWGADYGEDVHVHRTRTDAQARRRNRGQGSIYWVISGRRPLPPADPAARRSDRRRGAWPAATSSWRPTWCASRRGPSGRSRAGAISIPRTRRPTSAPAASHEDGRSNIAEELARLGLI